MNKQTPLERLVNAIEHLIRGFREGDYGSHDEQLAYAYLVLERLSLILADWEGSGEDSRRRFLGALGISVDWKRGGV